MTDPTPNDLRQPIDSRSLIAEGAVRGAIGGFCWSLLAAIPIAWMFWNAPALGGPVGAILSAGLTSLIWAGIAANAGAGRTREKTFTNEQRAVLHRRTRRSALQGLFFSLPVAAFLLFGTWGYGALGAILNAAMLVGIWVGSAALVGHGLGRKAVRAMQRETKEKAEQADLRRGPGDPNPLPLRSEKVQLDLARLTEARKPDAKHPINKGLED